MTTLAASRGINVPAHDQAPARPPALRVASVRKLYDRLEAIREVSVDVADGEFVSVLGPSGCGKSTLLMMVAGLIDATGGTITINGTPVEGPRREVGVVFQSPVLLPWRTVMQNLGFVQQANYTRAECPKATGAASEQRPCALAQHRAAHQRHRRRTVA